jgi:hypothetical protein
LGRVDYRAACAERTSLYRVKQAFNARPHAPGLMGIEHQAAQISSVSEAHSVECRERQTRATACPI